MTAALLSLLALLAQPLPMGQMGMTTAEEIAVICALLGAMVVGIWLHWRSKKRK
jgi:predicted ABC-type exoprotein transport system permease subunit